MGIIFSIITYTFLALNVVVWSFVVVVGFVYLCSLFVSDDIIEHIKNKEKVKNGRLER